nr:hypothetical protein [Tanacetum cinerariifolium]
VLSSRWRYIWTSIPFLDFSTEDFSTLPEFSESVNHVISRRNNQAQVYSNKLSFCGSVTQDSAKQILNYAFSHDIQHLEVTFMLEDDVKFPFSLFSSHSLKHLSLKREFLYDKSIKKVLQMRSLSYEHTITSTLYLPAITTLYLSRVTLCCDDKTYKSVGPLSKCTNIKNLTLESCKTVGYNGFSCSHPLLSNLSLSGADGRLNAVKVITHQLKSLTIVHWSGIPYFVTAPNLDSLVCDGYHPLCIFSNGFGPLEKVDLCVSCRDIKYALKMFSLLQHLHSVKFLRLNLEIVELLSSSLELLSDLPSSFSNLKSLKIYPNDVERTPKKANMSMEVKNYLLDGSLSATFTMVTREFLYAQYGVKLIFNLLPPHYMLRHMRELLELLVSSDHGRRQSVSSYLLKMKGYIDNLERLGHPVTLGLGKLNKHKKPQPQMAARGQNHGKEKNKLAYAPKPKIPPPPKREDPTKDSICHECGEIGHWKRNYPQYLSELLKKKKLSQGASNSDGFINRFMNNTIQVSRNDMVYFSAIPRDGIFEIDLSYSYANDSSMSTRTHRPTDRMCLYTDAEKHELGDLGEPPANYKVALLDTESDKWLNAMNVEMQSMKDNEVWDLVKLPPNEKIVGSKCLFKKKTDMDGAIHTYKARFVVNGYTQTLRIDYEETFSPVADIRAKVYMEQPKGFVNSKYPNRVCKLKRSIYGLKQASRQWNKRFDDKIKKFGFIQNRDEPCVYLKASGSNINFLILYVDDILIMGNNITMLQDVKSYLGRCFAMKDLGKAAYILGIKIYRDRSWQLIVYGGDIKRELKVSCYTDAGYLTDADDLKSQTGYVFVLNSGAVDWKSAKQSIFATSSRLGVVPTIEEPISMYCDNTREISIAIESGITKGARHLRAKVRYLRKVIKYGDVKLKKVHTDDNLADPFTKALAFPKKTKHTRNSGMLPASSLM